MTIAAPKVDERTAPELLREISRFLPNWSRNELRKELQEGRPSGFDGALMQVVARFGELIINRLNRAPEKNFLAFLDLLGVSPLPMEAARVPLTFYLTPGNQNAIVPAGTQVAAPAPKGEQRPVVFETERDLFISSTKLDLLLTKNGQSDQYADISVTLAEPPESQATTLPYVVESRPIPHLLFIALPISPVASKFDRLRLTFAVEKTPGTAAVPPRMQWEVQAGDDEPLASKPSETPKPAPVETTKTVVLVPSADETENLTETGEIVFQDLPKIVPFAIQGLTSLWICCRLLTPLTGNTEKSREILQESQLSLIKNISAEIEHTGRDLPIEQGLWNVSTLDLTKDFYPFGERPRVGDTFYFAQREAFSKPDAKITIHLELTNPNSSTTGTALAARTSPPQLTWEFWNGTRWEELGVSGRHLRLGKESAAVVEPEFVDGTQSLWNSGDVSFRFSRPPVESSVNGIKNYWVRARITSGDYGKDTQVQQDPATGKVTLTSASFLPPVIRSISIGYEIKNESPLVTVITYNDFEFKPVDLCKAFRPFSALTPAEAPPALYFGFAQDALANQLTSSGENLTALLRPAISFPDGPVSAYVAVADVVAEESKAARVERVAATWEYWNGSVWRQFPVPDETQGLHKSGLIRFVVPKGFTMRKEFGRLRYWLRMHLDASASAPQVSSIHLNTIPALQGSIVVNDILGSSNGKPHQKFRTTQPLVLPGQKLEVREATMPPAEERARIARDEGSDAIQRVIDPVTGKQQFWVTWHEVPNFYGSEARDRHYVLDHVTGEVSFGDGDCGMLPSVLDSNIRMTRYRSGGGTKCNLPPHLLKQLVSAVPYVQKVTNWIASSGGTDPETNASLLERGPRGVRHRGRAVTVEDYEDLAMLGSREVARAKCVPLYDLKTDPDALRRRPGLTSLILVPNSTNPKPVPPLALFDRVLNFLDARRMAGNELVLVGPEYVRVDVSAEIVVVLPEVASQVELDVRHELERYLHPVTGGARGKGWEYGRLPLRFDLCGLIEKIEGVSHVRDLRIRVIPDRPGAERTGRSLICSGQHDLTIRLEEQFAADLAQSR